MFGILCFLFCLLPRLAFAVASCVCAGKTNHTNVTAHTHTHIHIHTYRATYVYRIGALSRALGNKSLRIYGYVSFGPFVLRRVRHMNTLWVCVCVCVCKITNKQILQLKFPFISLQQANRVKCGFHLERVLGAMGYIRWKNKRQLHNCLKINLKALRKDFTFFYLRSTIKAGCKKKKQVFILDTNHFLRAKTSIVLIKNYIYIMYIYFFFAYLTFLGAKQCWEILKNNR